MYKKIIINLNIIGDIMKKVIVILGIIMTIILIYSNQEEVIIIPNEAIRVRVIANSNSKSDIEIKEKIKDLINKIVDKDLENITSIDEARKIIKNSIKIINNSVEKELNNKDFNINYGLNYFPEKVFKGIKYKEGYYESLVVTIGEGNGNNYWCVLYPPLCLIDDNKEEYEYRFFIKDILNKYL